MTNMKKGLMLLAVLTLVIFSFMSCTSPATNDVQTVTYAEDVKYGTISINIPSATDSRTLDLPSVLSLVNHYEFAIYDTTKMITALASAYDTTTDTTVDVSNVTLSIPVGTYKVLGLAGYKEDYYAYPILLGSSLESNVVVQENIVTNVTLTFRRTELELNVPASASCGSLYDVTLSGNSGVSVLQPSYGSISYGPENNTSSVMINNLTNAQIWTGNVSITAPANPTSYNVTISDFYYNFYDPEYTGTVSLDMYNWYVAYQYIYTSPELLNEFKKSITFGATSHGLAINVIWE